MDDMENKLIKYRSNIPHREVSEAFKLYYETRDPKIRENLIYRYMPLVKKIVLKYKTDSIEEEDLIQMAYEILIMGIDSYNPYENSRFANYIHARIFDKMKKKNKIETNEISLTNIDIYSNENLEDAIISKAEEQYLMARIYDYMNQNISDKNVSIIKKSYGIDCSRQMDTQICKGEGISKQRIKQIKNGILFNLYLLLVKDNNYYPSPTIEKTPIFTTFPLSYKKIKKFNDLDFNKMEYLTLYDSCDKLSDSHRLVKKK